MKKSTLRAMVREEVAVAIQEVITELREPILEKKPKKKKVIREKQHFTSNKVLNDVLNETAYGGDEWETLGGETFDSSKMNGVLKGQYAEMMNGDTPTKVPQTDTEGRPVNPNGISDTLMDNLTKDYSKTLTAMDREAKKTRGNV